MLVAATGLKAVPAVTAAIVVVIVIEANVERLCGVPWVQQLADRRALVHVVLQLHL